METQKFFFDDRLLKMALMEFDELNAKYFNNEIKTFIFNKSNGINMIMWENQCELSFFYKGFRVGIINNVPFYDSQKVMKYRDNIDSELSKGLLPKQYQPTGFVILDIVDEGFENPVEKEKSEVENMLFDDNKENNDTSSNSENIRISTNKQPSGIVDFLKNINEIWKTMSLKERLMIIKNLICIQWLENIDKNGLQSGENDIMNLL